MLAEPDVMLLTINDAEDVPLPYARKIALELELSATGIAFVRNTPKEMFSQANEPAPVPVDDAVNGKLI